MSQSIKAVFDDECSKLEVGPKLVRRLAIYQVNFVNRNEEHIQFFGGHLLGVQVVRFLPADHDRWFDEIMEVDDGPLEARLLALPAVNADWKVSSDTMNLSCVWLSHAVYNSKLLNDKQKHEALINIMLVLQYKFFTSRLYRHFPYPADKGVAEATYAQLNYKFAIKQEGNWAAVLNARSEEIIAKVNKQGGKSIHYDTIAKMDDDKEVIYMLNDTQGRIRDMLKGIYDVFLTVHKQGIRISSTSSVVEHDGVEILKDKSKNLLAYGRYLNSIVSDKNTFIREELMNVIQKIMHTMPPRLFRETLEWMSDNYRQSGATVIEEVLNEMLIYSFDYLGDHRNLVTNTSDLPHLLSTLRGVIMSSRSQDPILFTLREKMEDIVKKATGNKNDSLIASVRTGVILYCVIRALTMKHYTSSV